MFVVIFKAELNQLDELYYQTANKLKELAFTQFNCLDFCSLTEQGKEITLSYWPDKAQIIAWKKHPAHQEAQRLGKERWYKSYQVEIVELLRCYSSNG